MSFSLNFPLFIVGSGLSHCAIEPPSTGSSDQMIADVLYIWHQR